MARRTSPLGEEGSKKLREMIKEYDIKTMDDVHNFVKMLTAETIQTALDAELENELGYSKYDYKNKNTDNSAKRLFLQDCPGKHGRSRYQRSP